MTCVLFLEMNGYRFIASEESAAAAVLELAAGKLSEREFLFWLQKNSESED